MPAPSRLENADARRIPLATLLVCAVLLTPTLGYRMGLDQGTFAYMSAELLEGRWPYLFTWDHQFPGGMLLHAVEMLVLGRSVTLFRVFDLVYQLANVMVIFAITRRLGSVSGGFLAAAIYALVYQGYGPWNTAQREGFALLFILSGLWLFLTAERRSPIRTAVGIGLGLGVAVTIKPTFLAYALLYAPEATRVRTLPRGRLVRLAATLSTALLMPSLLIIGWYWALGGLTALYEACIAYQTEVYVHRLRGTDPLWTFWLTRLQRVGGHAVGLAVVTAPFLLFGPHRRERRLVYVGYLASLFTVVVQGTFAGYHYLPGLGLGSILIGTTFSSLARVWLSGLHVPVAGRRLGLARLLAGLLVVAALPFYLEPSRVNAVVSGRFLEPPRPGEFRNGSVFDYTEDYRLAQYLRERTASTDRIQVWGHESLVYYLADRDAASRFQSSNPLTMRVPGEDITPMQRRWRREFLADLDRSPPVYISVVRDDRWWWAPGERTSFELLDDFSAFKAVIAGRYRLETTVGRFLVYRRREA